MRRIWLSDCTKGWQRVTRRSIESKMLALEEVTGDDALIAAEIPGQRIVDDMHRLRGENLHLHRRLCQRSDQ